MGERKPLNKYLPPDFDPSMVPRSKRPKDGLVSVRMMLPFSIQCLNCGEFMYQGRKFNSKKENMQGPDGKYLGIQRFRFFIKCTACSRPISFLTDPKNADYEMETGATRNYELKKDKEQTEEETARDQETEEKEAPMKALENRVLASQREMQEMDQLEEIKALNMRHLQLTNGKTSLEAQTQAVLEARDANLKPKTVSGDEAVTESGLTEIEEALVRSIKFGAPKETIQRLDENDERASEERRKQQAMMFEKQQEAVAKWNPKSRSLMPVVKVKRKRPGQKTSGDMDETKKQKPEPKVANGGGLGSLLGGYGSDSDSD